MLTSTPPKTKIAPAISSRRWPSIGRLQSAKEPVDSVGRPATDMLMGLLGLPSRPVPVGLLAALLDVEIFRRGEPR